MADSKITLEVYLKSKGIKPTAAELKKLNAEMKKTATATTTVSKGTNKLKRNLEGAAQRSGSTAKDFSRMQQGMGGLVAAYATVAANVFALSSAFLVLRRAADLSSMIKSAEDFSNRFGVSVTRITRQMQEASGGALDFADALPIINKAVAAGIPVEKMEALTVAATKAAQTFGGSATEALNRFISASQRGRVEIIQTLGIVIKTEQAYKDYGAAIGKTALELTAFDRQQAILNATIEESQNVFDGIGIDPNPFQQLLTTLTDLKNTILTTITDAVTPMVNAFNQSKFAAAALIAVMLKLVGGKIFGQVAIGVAAAAKAGKETTLQARAAEQRAQDVARRRDNRLKSAVVNKEKALRAEVVAFETALKKQEKAHASFTKKILLQEKGLNIGVATERRAALARNIKSLSGGGKAFAGLPGLEESKRQLVVIDRLLLSVAGSAAKANQSTATMSKTLAATTTKGVRNLSIIEAKLAAISARSISVRSAFKTGFAQGFQIAEGKVVKSIRGMTVAWKIFIRDIGSGAAKAKSNLVNLSSAMGRTAGVVAAGFSKLLSLTTTAFLVYTIGAAVWEKYGDSIRGITPAMRAVIDAGEEMDEALLEVNERTAEGIVKLGTEMPQSLKKLQDALKFTTGTFNSINSAITNFQKATVESLNNLTPELAISRVRDLNAELTELENVERSKIATSGFIGQITPPGEAARITEIKDELEKLDGVLKSIAEETSLRFVESLTLSTDLAKKIGFSNIGGLLEAEFKKADLGASISLPEFFDLKAVFAEGDVKKIKARIKDMESSFGESGEAYGVFLNKLLNLVSGFNSAVAETAATQDRALGSLSDVDSRITTFIGGLDKLKAASGPNKEFTAFTLDINRELNTLNDLQEGLTENSELSRIFGDKTQLAAVKAFLGFSADTVVKIGDAQTAAKDLQDDLLAQQEAMALRGDRLKVLAIDLSTIKAREIKTDDQRLKQIEDRLAAERKVTALLLSNAQANVAAQERVLISKKFLKASEEQQKVDRSQLRVYEAQRDELIERQKVQAQNLDFQREEAKIINETLNAIKAVNAVWFQIQTIRQKISGNNVEDLKARRALFRLRQESFKIEKAIIEQKIIEFHINSLTKEQNIKDKQALDAKLILLQAQSAEFERQNALSLAGREIQAAGDTFNAQGMRNLGNIFVQTVRDGVRNLASVTETLGKGFAKAATDTLDSAVDKLFEGHGFSGFLDNLVEALKTGLRETFSEAIKNQINSAFASIFKSNPPLERNTSAVEKLGISIDNLNATMGSMGLGGAGTGAEGSGFGSAMGIINKILPLLPFGRGGITPGPIQQMATGGVTSGPQVAVIGEGKNREAVVPLPNNREIPVQLSGDGGGDTISIEQNFDFRNADASTVTQLRAEAKNIEDRTFNKVFNEINKGGRYAKMSGRR